MKKFYDWMSKQGRVTARDLDAQAGAPRGSRWLAVLEAVGLVLTLGITLLAATNVHAGCLTHKDDNGGRGLHIIGSTMLSAGISLSYPDMPYWQQVGWTMLPGIGKEVYDCYSYGLFSRNDIRSDLIGALVGAGLGNGFMLSAGAKSVAVSYAAKF